jgi:DNA-binding beta-propeller fold protein YncE
LIIGSTRLTPTRVITKLPPELTGYSTTAEIAVTPDGGFMYCANRGHASIAIFDANVTNGTPTSIGCGADAGSHTSLHRPCSHATISVSGQCGRRQSRDVPGCGITGKLTPTGQVVDSAIPVTIVFAGAPRAAVYIAKPKGIAKAKSAAASGREKRLGRTRRGSTTRDRELAIELSQPKC